MIAMMKLKFALLASLALLSLETSAGASSWLESHVDSSTRKLLANVSVPGAQLGSVIASPSRADPDYYFHWTRDAALAMDALVSLDERAQTASERAPIRQAILDYVFFSRVNQMAPALSDLGEPKYHVNGSPYMGPWGRPQNDGPALRAITLIRFARILLREGQGEFVRAMLYDSRLPTHSVIKTDLEYISHHAFEKSFDVWEEVKGDHFFTRMVIRRALVEGAKLARTLSDPGAADWYEERAQIMSREIESHWDAQEQVIQPTLGQTEGADYKTSGIDTAVILGVLHGYANDGFFAPEDPRVIATLRRQRAVFATLYPINHDAGDLGDAIGRYPEDRYSGSDFLGGNPWVLTTLAFSELLFRAAPFLALPERTVALRDAHAFVMRVAKHANPDGSLSEQINRQNGFMMSARDLTWNYAAVLNAWIAKEAAIHSQ